MTIILEDVSTYPRSWQKPKVVDYFTKGDSDYVVVQHANGSTDTLKHISEGEWEVVNDSTKHLIDSTKPDVGDYRMASVSSINGRKLEEEPDTMFYTVLDKLDATDPKLFSRYGVEAVVEVVRNVLQGRDSTKVLPSDISELIQEIISKVEDGANLTEYGATSSVATGTKPATTTASAPPNPNQKGSVGQFQPADPKDPAQAQAAASQPQQGSTGQTQQPAAQQPKVATVDTGADPADATPQQVGQMLKDKLGKAVDDPALSKELTTILGKIKT